MKWRDLSCVHEQYNRAANPSVGLCEPSRELLNSVLGKLASCLKTFQVQRGELSQRVSGYVDDARLDEMLLCQKQATYPQPFLALGSLAWKYQDKPKLLFQSRASSNVRRRINELAGATCPETSCFLSENTRSWCSMKTTVRISGMIALVFRRYTDVLKH